MFYHLFYPLRDTLPGFGIFRFISFRAAGATITALLISLVVAPYVIRKLKSFKVQPKVREDGPPGHLAKEGTPTMGGIIILLAITISTLLWARLNNTYILIVLFSTLWLGAIGFIDDYLGAVKKVPKGLIGRYKLAGQMILGLSIGVFLYAVSISPEEARLATATELPFFKNHIINFDFELFGLSFGWIYILFVALVITGTSNAVNLTDGLDGLAAGLVGIAFSAFAVIGYIAGRVDFTGYLNILYLPGSGELSVFCLSAVGGALGFLWYNSPPAKIWMGDTGALSLGGSLGTVAILIKKELLLPVIGGIFVAAVVSVMLQVISFKRRGKRVFLMAPIHHHFELKGWTESQVIVRFWIIGILLALVGLSTLKIR